MAGIYTVTQRTDGELLTAAKYNTDRQDLSDNLTSTTTFTPTVAGLTSTGTCSYTIQQGKYTRINDLVFFSVVVQWTGHTGTGQLAIQGLPVTSTATPVNIQWPVSWQYTGTGAALTGVPIGIIYPGETQIRAFYTKTSDDTQQNHGVAANGLIV